MTPLKWNKPKTRTVILHLKMLDAAGNQAVSTHRFKGQFARVRKKRKGTKP